LNPRPTA